MWPFNKKEKYTFEIDKDVYAKFCIACAQKNVNDIIEELIKNYINNSNDVINNNAVELDITNVTKPHKTYILKDQACTEKEFESYLKKTSSCVVNVSLLYINGKTEQKVWKVTNFTEDTKLNQNLSSGYLRDWKTKGIIEIKLKAE